VEVEPGSAPGRLRITAEGGPNDLIRKLWNYHATYVGEAGGAGEVPSWFRMDEEVVRGDLLSEASFTSGRALSCRRFVGEVKPWKTTLLPGIRDLFAAMLFVRSQPLLQGDHVRVIVFPDQNPYLVDLTVAGRDILRMDGKSIPAVRFTIGIQAIATGSADFGTLYPHRKFRSGRIWMTDDERRLPLKAEVDVFIGSVYAELANLHPDQ
jgi:hypothetical protein